MTAPPALSVPRYVLGALQDALAIEDELHAMLSRRQSKIPELHTALMRWHAAQPDRSDRALKGAIYRHLGLKHGTDEYLRVAQLLSRAWRFDPSAPAGGEKLVLPREVEREVKLLAPRLEKMGWEVVNVARRPHFVLVKLRPSSGAHIE